MPRNGLLIIDMQNDFLDRWEDDGRAKLISKTNQLISVFRDVGCPILWVRQVFKSDLSDAFLEMKDNDISIVIDGTRGAEIHADLAIQGGDKVIVKKRYSANTAIHDALKYRLVWEFIARSLDEYMYRIRKASRPMVGVNDAQCLR